MIHFERSDWWSLGVTLHFFGWETHIHIQLIWVDVEVGLPGCIVALCKDDPLDRQEG